MELYKTVIDGEQFTVRPKPTELQPERAKVTFDGGHAVFDTLEASKQWDTEDQSSSVRNAARAYAGWFSAYAKWLSDSAERLSVPEEKPVLTPYDTGEVLEPKIWPTDGDPTRFGKVDFENDGGGTLFTARTVATPYGYRLEVEVHHGHALDVRVMGQ